MLARKFAAAVTLGASLAVLSDTAMAQTDRLREAIAERRAGLVGSELDDDGGPPSRHQLPAGARAMRELSYGSDARQRFDIYLPALAVAGKADPAPAIFLVHGGGWRRGDKAHGVLLENKLAHWLPKGIAIISVNYRLLPDADPVEQSRDIARALAAAQDKAASVGLDKNRFMLMGHSAGAHLVAMVLASRELSAQARAPVKGGVLLDGAALDVPGIMQGRHFRLHDEAFGKDPAFWKAASPYHVLEKAAVPMLVVCASGRHISCEQSDRFAARAIAVGGQASVLRQSLSHKEINQRLGESGAYTEAVDAFLLPLLGKQ